MSKKTNNKEESFDYKTIKSFEDACKKANIATTLPDLSMLPEEFIKPVLAAYKLMVIFKAINNGWTPDWNNSNQYKYYPWFRANAGFGFSHSYYADSNSVTVVGSRLCFKTEALARYAGQQFEAVYKDFII